MLNLLSNPWQLVSWLLIFIVSIGLHEFGHAVVADLMGDPTPRAQGRVTLNPFAHLDPIGTLLMLVPPHFGWGKSVMTQPHHYRSPRWGGLAVAIAGPFMNFVLALLAIVAIKHVPQLGYGTPGFRWCDEVFVLNLVLMVFNLLPIPPLDGSNVLRALLPRRWLPAYQHLVPYGAVALILLIMLPGAQMPLMTLESAVGMWMMSWV